ncbi:alpha/beta hydrolase [Corynebacterium sp. TAE3-ERU12]|uniref:alpha/beta hydrolase n=1 Tax=Corynebacterium sp. TAE3-ERU12 TaxID=2849491 RepID=UPI001C46AEC0|nr:alpha/beta hydrolase [Corynebacterium sp. TAE3-ERU12]MBV7295535.1 alpha/beta hydrolase [Corynebacterium sp. TAE3-ERU12]
MSEDGFTPVTTDTARLQQLVDYLEEHTSCFSGPAITTPLRSDYDTDEAWLDAVATARAQADGAAARRPDAVVHAAMLVLGAGVDHTPPAVAYVTAQTRWDNVVIDVHPHPRWPEGELRRADGGADAFPESPTPYRLQDTINATVYRPSAPTGAVVISVHGGAWWAGGGANRDNAHGPDCAALAERSGAVVLDIDNRLAPEYPLPATIDDIACAVAWAQHNLGATSTNTVLWGTSSGAHACLLAALTGTEAALLALTMPAIDLTGTRSADVPWIYGQEGLDPASAVVSPVRADPSKLPPVYVQTGSADDRAFGGPELAAATDGVVDEFLATHTIAAPAEQRRRITALARQILQATGTHRELADDPAGEYSKEAVDEANQRAWS